MMYFTKLIQRTSIMIGIGLTFFQFSVAQNQVIGYLPVWGNFPNNIQNVDLDIVTHIDVAFVNPDINGTLGLPNGLSTLVDICHAKNVKVLIFVGGAGPNKNVYSTILGSASPIQYS